MKIEIDEETLTEIICSLYDGAKHQKEKELIFTAKRTEELIHELIILKEEQKQ